ncbi:hypothetical protein HMPREF1510_1968 [Streptococcus sp. ACC21]|nr:hypothetical protein HMPREF1510_1968 [Streptococcus sp. ACC21]EWC97120.1 hypothetical protein HMPREF1509_1171 [Streptococcus sp. AC15]
MKIFDKNSIEYRAMKNHWKFPQKNKWKFMITLLFTHNETASKFLES